MATHDYVIANGSGAAVRSDLNNALAAIVSNNSSSTEPATTYAYQWWADTNDNVLKIRNSANNAWITLRELDGTMLIEDGSASTPGLAFADDTNTGIFSGAADQIAFATGGAERLEIGSSEVVFNDPSNDVDFRVESNGNANMLFVDGGNDRVGIATGSPSAPFHLNAGTTNNALFVDSSDAEVSIGLAASDGSIRLLQSSKALVVRTNGDANAFGTGDSEALRVDSSGRLLINHTADAAPDAFESTLQLVDTSYEGSSMTIRRDVNTDASPVFMFAKSRSGSKGGHTSVNSGDNVGQILFYAADGTDTNTKCAEIRAQIDGTPGSNDMPGRLTFYTTADGASSPTEQLRIDSDGALMSAAGTSTASTNDNHHQFHTSFNNYGIRIKTHNTSQTADAIRGENNRSASQNYALLTLFTGDGSTNGFSDKEFRFRGDGSAYADGDWNTGGADYAEYFEWSDGNASEEDRRGISVVLDGDKIREAVAGEDPIGVISGNPSVVGDAAWSKWNGKHLRDDFGSYLTDTHNVVKWTETITDDDGNETTQEHVYEDWNVPDGIVVPDDAVVSATDENGKPFTHRRLNPDYDPDVTYVPREDRAEWDCVGLMGKLRIRKGQVTGSRWIKMRDVSATVEEWLVR